MLIWYSEFQVAERGGGGGGVALAVAVVVSARHEDPACNNFAQQWPR